MNIEEIKELIKEVSASELVQFDLQEGNIKLSLKKEGAIVHESIHTLPDESEQNLNRNVTAGGSKVDISSDTYVTDAEKSQTDVTQALLAQTNMSNNSLSSKSAMSKGFVVKSPLVGTAHLINEETGEPFVTVGTKVKKGQTLAVVEAMKMMNDIEAETDGTIEDKIITWEITARNIVIVQ